MNFSSDDRVEYLNTKSRSLVGKIEGIVVGTSVLMWLTIIFNILSIIGLFMDNDEELIGPYVVNVVVSVSFMLAIKAIGGFMGFMIENGMQQTLIMKEMKGGMTDIQKEVSNNIRVNTGKTTTAAAIDLSEELPEL